MQHGILLGLLGRHAEAAAYVNWAAQASPTSALVLTEQCANLNRLGNYEEALAACQKLLPL
ncbi:MAG: hypothetical protein F6J93_30175 [Oscillatoria sp. SIO1A7]|nr:hypothetical protein [Oscillatoria sp. SIO1A7]